MTPEQIATRIAKIKPSIRHRGEVEALFLLNALAAETKRTNEAMETVVVLSNNPLVRKLVESDGILGDMLLEKTQQLTDLIAREAQASHSAECLRVALRASELEVQRREADCAAMRQALNDVSQILTVPAAEYVPAIPDAWKRIDAALNSTTAGAELLARVGELAAQIVQLQGELEHRCKEYRILSDDHELLEAAIADYQAGIEQRNDQLVKLQAEREEATGKEEADA